MGEERQLEELLEKSNIFAPRLSSKTEKKLVAASSGPVSLSMPSSPRGSSI
ncbi:hypothetical protein Leryth_016766, partial [Lithospermum erythrorhizon]